MSKKKETKDTVYKEWRAGRKSELSEVYTIREASEKYKRSESFFRKCINDGTFDLYKTDKLIRQSGSTWLISKFALDHYFADNFVELYEEG